MSMPQKKNFQCEYKEKESRCLTNVRWGYTLIEGLITPEPGCRCIRHTEAKMKRRADKEARMISNAEKADEVREARRAKLYHYMDNEGHIHTVRKQMFQYAMAKGFAPVTLTEVPN